MYPALQAARTALIATTVLLLVQGAARTLLCGAVQEYGYQHIRFVNCTNLSVSGPAVMYNSPSRLPFTQATIVNASADARNWTIQVVSYLCQERVTGIGVMQREVLGYSRVASPSEPVRGPSTRLREAVLRCRI